MERYVDVDRLIAELNETYKSCMTEMAIMPLGLENWLNSRARRIPGRAMDWEPSKEKLAEWTAQINELHKDNSLDATIKELAVIVAEYEENRIDHLQMECYKRALGFLVQFWRMLREEDEP